MPRLTPRNLDGFMPSEDARQAAAKYLHIVGLDLPRTTSRVLLVPEQSWDLCGHVIGPSIAHLNFQDNSVLFVATASWIDEPILPPFEAEISLPFFEETYRIDDKAVEFLLEVIGGSRQDAQAMENAIGPFLSMPLVAEAATVRRRGLPLCTPLLVPFGWADLDSVGSVIAELVRKMGVSIVISSEMLADLPDEDPHSIAVPESVASMVPQFVERVQTETKRDATACRLFQSLARETNEEIFKLWDGRAVRDDKLVKSYSMCTKHTSFSKGGPSAWMFPYAWRSVSDLLTGRPELDRMLPEMPALLELRMKNHSIVAGRVRNVPLNLSLRDAALDLSETLEEFGTSLEDIPGDSYLRIILLDSFRPVPRDGRTLEKRLASGDHGVLLQDAEGKQRSIMPWEIGRYGDKALWYVEETESQLVSEGSTEVSMWTFKAKDMPARLSWVMDAIWE